MHAYPRLACNRRGKQALNNFCTCKGKTRQTSPRSRPLRGDTGGAQPRAAGPPPPLPLTSPPPEQVIGKPRGYEEGGGGASASPLLSTAQDGATIATARFSYGGALVARSGPYLCGSGSLLAGSARSWCGWLEEEAGAELGGRWRHQVAGVRVRFGSAVMVRRVWRRQCGQSGGSGLNGGGTALDPFSLDAVVATSLAR